MFKTTIFWTSIEQKRPAQGDVCFVAAEDGTMLAGPLHWNGKYWESFYEPGRPVRQDIGYWRSVGGLKVEKYKSHKKGVK